jgi:phosphoadenosine phosphosulfate reductase
MMATLEAQIAELQPDAELWTAPRALEFGLRTYGESLAIASSFGAEDVVLIDMAARLGVNFRVFTLDTDFLFPETYALIDTIEQKYNFAVERTRPEFSPEAQAEQFGPALWSVRPDQCCDIRKVEPLKKFLSGLQAWVTGVRRDQAPTRANTKKLEWDGKFGLVKLNPIADWTSDQVWDYIRSNHLAYNPLHDQNYPSIGCTYCTRPVLPGEDPRAGRWAGFNKIECGLHLNEEKSR